VRRRSLALIKIRDDHSRILFALPQRAIVSRDYTQNPFGLLTLLQNIIVKRKKKEQKKFRPQTPREVLAKPLHIIHPGVTFRAWWSTVYLTNRLCTWREQASVTSKSWYLLAPGFTFNARFYTQRFLPFCHIIIQDILFFLILTLRQTTAFPLNSSKGKEYFCVIYRKDIWAFRRSHWRYEGKRGGLFSWREFPPCFSKNEEKKNSSPRDSGISVQCSLTQIIRIGINRLLLWFLGTPCMKRTFHQELLTSRKSLLAHIFCNMTACHLRKIRDLPPLAASHERAGFLFLPSITPASIEVRKNRAYITRPRCGNVIKYKKG
jgi:hypothetical protein